MVKRLQTFLRGRSLVLSVQLNLEACGASHKLLNFKLHIIPSPARYQGAPALIKRVLRLINSTNYIISASWVLEIFVQRTKSAHSHVSCCEEAEEASAQTWFPNIVLTWSCIRIYIHIYLFSLKYIVKLTGSVTWQLFYARKTPVLYHEL